MDISVNNQAINELRDVKTKWFTIKERQGHSGQ